MDLLSSVPGEGSIGPLTSLSISSVHVTNSSIHSLVVILQSLQMFLNSLPWSFTENGNQEKKLTVVEHKFT